MASGGRRNKADYGIDAAGAVRWMAIGASLGALLGWALTRAGLRWGRWIAAGSLFLLLNPLGMLASSKFGKLKQRDAVLDAVDFAGDEQVLDVGTGRGLMAIGAAKRLRSGHVFGVDIWQERDLGHNTLANTLGNVEVERVGDRCTIETGDARELPFPDESFDVVLACFALHNLPNAADKRRACFEIARVLKPGGRLFDYDILFTTGIFVEALASRGLEVQQSGVVWRTYPPGRLIVARKPRPANAATREPGLAASAAGEPAGAR